MKREYEQEIRRISQRLLTSSGPGWTVGGKQPAYNDFAPASKSYTVQAKAQPTAPTVARSEMSREPSKRERERRMASSLIWYTYPHILFLFFCKYKKQEIKQEKKGGTDLRMQWPAGRTGQALNQTSISSAFAHTTHTHVGPKQCGASAHGLLLHSVRVCPSRSIPST